MHLCRVLKQLRHLLWPFALLYGAITWLRNKFYDWHIFKQSSFSVPVIAVGNLNTGGTGKTPHVEYLLRCLSDTYKIGVISRGYGRKTKGFILVQENSYAAECGDEPVQIKKKFPRVPVAVCEDRELAIPMLLSEFPEINLILLDDAFQHRSVKADVYVLLSRYDDLFIRDFMLPVGNLREHKAGAERADILVVTKCPLSISEREKEKIVSQIKLPGQEIFFSTFEHTAPRFLSGKQVTEGEMPAWKEKKLILFSAIAGGSAWATPYEEYFSETAEKISFRDHHRFTGYDIQILERAIGKHGKENCIVLTTEKDIMRLKELKLPHLSETIAYFPIVVRILDDKSPDIYLINLIKARVGNNE